MASIHLLSVISCNLLPRSTSFYCIPKVIGMRRLKVVFYWKNRPNHKNALRYLLHKAFFTIRFYFDEFIP